MLSANHIATVHVLTCSQRNAKAELKLDFGRGHLETNVQVQALLAVTGWEEKEKEAEELTRIRNYWIRMRIRRP